MNQFQKQSEYETMQSKFFKDIQNFLIHFMHLFAKTKIFVLIMISINYTNNLVDRAFKVCNT